MSTVSRSENVQFLNSCLVASEWYQILDDGEIPEDHIFEEIHNKIRHTSVVPYTTVQAKCGEQLWMLPFQSSEQQLDDLLDVMERVQEHFPRDPNLVFPVDVVLGEEGYGCLYRPVDRQETKPIRCFMPCEEGPRWEFAIQLFQRIQQLHQVLDLTSNGICRWQLRADPATGNVKLWLMHTLSEDEDGQTERMTDDSDCFFRVPDFTVETCERKGLPVTGKQRDIFSAAVSAFYMLLHSHPFIGSDFFSRIRTDYPVYYQNGPKYIFEPHTSNCPGNMALDNMILMQWKQTVPQLKKLFDQLFMAVTYPETHWKAEMECWDLQQWIDALTLDKETNSATSCPISQEFTREWQRLV